MRYANKHNFYQTFTELMSKCFLENAQDPFLLIADTIYQNKGIDHSLKIKKLEEKITTYENYMKSLDLAIIDDSDENNLKDAYESFGKSMVESDDAHSIIEIGPDIIMIEENVINVPTTKEPAVREPVSDSCNEEQTPVIQSIICEESLDSLDTRFTSGKPLNQSHVVIDETLESPSIITNIPIIDLVPPQVSPSIVSQDEVEALIDDRIATISDHNQEPNEVVKDNVYNDTMFSLSNTMFNSQFDAETLEIENALKALCSEDTEFEPRMEEPTNVVINDTPKKSPIEQLSLTSDDNFEPDYEDSE